MRCKWLCCFAMATVAGLAGRLAIAEEVRQLSPLPAPSGEIQVREQKPSGVMPARFLAEPEAAKPLTPKPPAAMPSGAKPKPVGSVRPAAATSSAVARPSTPAPTGEPADAGPKPSRNAKPPAKGTELKAVIAAPPPSGEPQESPTTSVETASFKGVVPGVSTSADVQKALGKPKDQKDLDGSLIQLYSVPPFSKIEVSYSGDKVSSIVIRFERSFPVEAVATQLDLTAIRPVSVLSDSGEALGLAYPERGVLFTYERNAASGKGPRKVPQVVLESLSAEPFLLRAEATLDSRPDLSRRDAEQAIKLEPENARAHWLLGRLLAAAGQPHRALVASGKAVKLDATNPQYRVTHAQILAQAGRLSDAAEAAGRAAKLSDAQPHVKARAVCLKADLLASGAKPDFRQALQLHSLALQIADPLTASPNRAIRVAAKEVLIDAHLGAAHDIAWGEWKEKAKAVSRWLDRASTAAEELVANDGGSREVLFRFNARSLAACVNLEGEIDPEPAAKAVLVAGQSLIEAASEPSRKAQLEWELGMALYDAVQICQARSDNAAALKHGEVAAKYLAAANKSKPSPATVVLLGRLYFRLGAIEAISRHDHKAAVVWFDKATPLIEHLSPDELTGNLGRHGESLVTMGVSYWEIGQQKKAVALSQKGIKWMERAVDQGSLARSSLDIPYANLAAMHRALGADEQADHFQELANRVKEGKSK